MITIANLMDDNALADEHAWRDQVFEFASNMGYEKVLLALFPSHDTPISLRNAIAHTNLPDTFIERYDDGNMAELDPVISHCLRKTTPLIWTESDFTAELLQELFATNTQHGLSSGLSFPFHGPNGEFGFLSFYSTASGGGKFQRMAQQQLPELSFFRDFIMDKFLALMQKGKAVTKGEIDLTSRELECLKWCATGKSSWDIAQLMNCTEATVNYHFANIRRKFGASSRRMAVIKAIRMGFIRA